MSDDDQERSGLAQDRTDLAEDRTILAAERTFAGWMRTAYAAIGVGIAFHGLFGAMEPSWLPRAVATLFILLGAIVVTGAERRIGHTFDRLSTHEVVRARKPRLRWLSVATVIGAMVLIAALWIVHRPG